MRRVALIQARMTSSRLPGKVLADLVGAPMLARQIGRLTCCEQLDDIVVATTDNRADDPVVALARSCGVRWFRGSERDVLGRFVGASRESGADVLVRLTGDCPLSDPGVVGRVIEALCERAEAADYASNVVRRSFPRGLDAEALFADTLERIQRLSTTAPQREHVTLLPRADRPDLFLCRDLVDDQDNSALRWTVDDPADLAFMRRLWTALDLVDRPLDYRAILAATAGRKDLQLFDDEDKTWSPAATGSDLW